MGRGCTSARRLGGRLAKLDVVWSDDIFLGHRATSGEVIVGTAEDTNDPEQAVRRQEVPRELEPLDVGPMQAGFGAERARGRVPDVVLEHPTSRPVRSDGKGKLPHVELQVMWLQQAARSGRIFIKKMVGAMNLANSMTKAPPRARHGAEARLARHAFRGGADRGLGHRLRRGMHALQEFGSHFGHSSATWISGYPRCVRRGGVLVDMPCTTPTHGACCESSRAWAFGSSRKTASSIALDTYA